MSTPARRMGLREGSHVVFKGNGSDAGFRYGQILVLEVDDCTTSPLFRNLDNTCNEFINLDLIQAQETNEMTQVNMQELAVKTFTTIVERATAYRETGASNRDLFNPRYGICDNVSLCMPEEHRNRYHDAMLHVKDNLIRQVPSFSGAYHYPVPAPGVNRADHERMKTEAENYYDSNSDKWVGDYGYERLIQAKELLDIIVNKWDDRYVTNMTPAQRNGYVEMETVLIHKTEGNLYMLSRDDGSSDPYFIPFGDEDQSNRRAIQLGDLRPYKLEDVGPRSVSSLVNEINRRRKARLKLEEKVKELQSQIRAMRIDSSSLEAALRMQHGVKVIKS